MIIKLFKAGIKWAIFALKWSKNVFRVLKENITVAFRENSIVFKL